MTIGLTGCPICGSRKTDHEGYHHCSRAALDRIDREERSAREEETDETPDESERLETGLRQMEESFS